MDERPTDGPPHPARRVVRPLVAAGVALLALGALLWLVGVEAVHADLARVGPWEAATLVATGFLPVLVWGVELRVILGGLGHPVGTVEAVALFAASGFLNNVTPLGEVGGDPPSGLLIAGVRGIGFERGLAAIASTNAVNRVAVVGLGLAGLAVVGPAEAGPSALLAVAIWGVLVALLVAAWVYREWLVSRVGPSLAAAVARVARWPPLEPTPTPSAVEARIEGFVRAIERLAADPRRLLAALLLGAVGHIAAAATLWLALRAIGVSVPVQDLLVVLPLAKASGLSPTPGGAGNAALLLAGLLVAVAGVGSTDAATAALLYRAAAFWVPTAAGGVVAAALVVRWARP